MTITDVTTDFHDAEWFARRLGRPTAWVRKHAPVLPHHKFGRLIRYCECCVERYRESTKVLGEAEFQLSTRGKR